MANITRYTPFDDLFTEFTKGFWVKPLAIPAGTEVNIKVDVKEDDKGYTVLPARAPARLGCACLPDPSARRGPCSGWRNRDAAAAPPN